MKYLVTTLLSLFTLSYLASAGDLGQWQTQMQNGSKESMEKADKLFKEAQTADPEKAAKLTEEANKYKAMAEKKATLAAAIATGDQEKIQAANADLTKFTQDHWKSQLTFEAKCYNEKANKMLEQSKTESPDEAAKLTAKANYMKGMADKKSALAAALSTGDQAKIEAAKQDMMKFSQSNEPKK
ncbi:MAG: hypothetical protein SGI98_12160 [Verrucomicrobiota bacterium]|nr:hypothetical protein [Verrucomicrobiota bacterium]